MSWKRANVIHWWFVRMAALTVCLSVLAVTVEAAKLRVKVVQSVDEIPRPILQGATVCYRRAHTPNAPILGTKMTDSNGIADFGEVAEGDYDVLLTAPNFKGEVERLFMRSVDASPTFAIDPGQDTSGITCPTLALQVQSMATATFKIDHPAPQILTFKVNDGAESTTSRQVTLKATFDRTPKFYRAGETDRTAATWTEYPSNGSMTVTLRDKKNDSFGERDVYLQIRTEDGKKSEVAHDTIKLVPILSDRTFTGAQLKEVLKYALDQGFKVSGKFLAGKNDCGPTVGALIYGASIELPGANVSLDPAVNLAKIYEASFLTERHLNAHWTLKSPLFSKAGSWRDPYARYTVTKSPNAESPSFTVQLNIAPYPQGPFEPLIAPCGEVGVILKSITLSGPMDLDWREAFKK